MLDQAGRRIDLGTFLLRTRDRRQRDIEKDSPRRGRALVDREKIIGQACSFAPPRPPTAPLGRRRSIHVAYISGSQGDGICHPPPPAVAAMKFAKRRRSSDEKCKPSFVRRHSTSSSVCAHSRSIK